GADVDPRAHVRVADIGQVIGLAVFAERRILDFDEIAHVAARPEPRPRPQPGIGADARARPGLRAIQVAERLDPGAFAQPDVAQHAIGPDAHAVGQLDLAFEHAAHVDVDITPARQRAA